MTANARNYVVPDVDRYLNTLYMQLVLLMGVMRGVLENARIVAIMRRLFVLSGIKA